MGKSQSSVNYTFFNDEPYYFRINLDQNTRGDGDLWGITNIKVYNIPEHRINPNRLFFNTVVNPSGSKDNFNVQRQIPRTDLQYSWLTGSLSLSSSATSSWDPTSQVRNPSKLDQQSFYNRTNNATASLTSSFFYNTKQVQINAGLFNVNLKNNTIELSSSYTASLLTRFFDKL